jgi:hypothetical protein
LRGYGDSDSEVSFGKFDAAVAVMYSARLGGQFDLL